MVFCSNSTRRFCGRLNSALARYPSPSTAIQATLLQLSRSTRRWIFSGAAGNENCPFISRVDPSVDSTHKAGERVIRCRCHGRANNTLNSRRCASEFSSVCICRYKRHFQFLTAQRGLARRSNALCDPLKFIHKLRCILMRDDPMMLRPIRCILVNK